MNTEKYFLGSAVNLRDIRLSLKRNVNKSKRYALLNPPVTSNINHWVSDKIRKIWEPRIISIAKVWEEIEILSVSDGLRDCCCVCGIYNHELLSLADRHPELSIFLDRDTRGICHEVYITRRDSKIPFKNIELFDVSLGYPSCCYNSHNVNWSWTTTVTGCCPGMWEAALNTVKDVNNNLIDIECVPELNFLLGNINLNAIPHIPCSFNCKESISQGIKYMNIGRKYGFSEEMDWLKEILSWPMEWSFSNDIEKVRTPFFRVSSKQGKKSHKKYVIRLNPTTEILETDILEWILQSKGDTVVVRKL